MSNIYLSSDEITTEISMSSEVTPWLIVEGISDEIFYRNLSDSDIKIAVAGGWENVVDIVNESLTSLNITHVFGVIDKDFREPLNIFKTSSGVNIPDKNIYETDNIDLESLLFHSEVSLSSVLSNFSRTTCKMKHNEIFKHIINTTISLSKFRFYNQKQLFKISLSDIDHNKFIKGDLSFDVNAFIAHVNGKNSGNQNINLKTWEESQKLELPESISLSKRLCNGHDLLIILGLSLRKLYGNNQKKLVEKESIEKYFRMAYSRKDFEGTKLFQSISENIEF